MGGAAQEAQVEHLHEVGPVGRHPEIDEGIDAGIPAVHGQPPAAGIEVFPTLRRRDGIALIGLSTGVPKPPLLATGDLGAAQIARAERLLAETKREGLCRIVGAYEIEGPGIQLLERVEGDHFTIVGLPLVPLLAELRSRGVVVA